MPSACRPSRAVRHRLLPRRTRAGLLRLEVARRVRLRAASAPHIRSGDDLPLARGLRDRLGVARLRGGRRCVCRRLPRRGGRRRRSAQGLLRGIRALARRPRRGLLRAGEREPRVPGALSGGGSRTRRRMADETLRGRGRGGRGGPPRDGRFVGPCAPSSRGVRRARGRPGARPDRRAGRRARGCGQPGTRRPRDREGEHRGRGVPDDSRDATSAWDEIDDLYVETHLGHRAGRASSLCISRRPVSAEGRARIRPSCGCSEQETLEPLDVPVPAELRLTVARARTPSARALSSSPSTSASALPNPAASPGVTSRTLSPSSSP